MLQKGFGTTGGEVNLNKVSLLRRIFPRKRITVGGVFVVLLASAILFSFLPHTNGLATICILGATVTGLILVWRLIRNLIRSSIWRLRNRLIVTYMFIAMIPIMLILVLVGLGGYIFAGQTALYLVNSELQRTLWSLELPARVISLNPDAPFPAMVAQTAPFLGQRFHRFQVVARAEGRVLRYPPDSSLEPAAADAPDYTGITIINHEYYAWAHRHTPQMTIDAVAPIEREMLGTLVPRLGRVDLGDFGVRSGVRLGSHRPTPEELRQGEADTIPPPSSQFDYEVNWFSPVTVVKWPTGARAESHFLFITTRPSALLNALFGDEFKVAQGFLFALVVVAVLFLLVEIISLVIGVSLTRSITGAMQNLYEGTQRVAEGDFSHRIRVKGRDQLAAVSSSFNSMAERVEKLIVVEKEKERLQSELEIAREVQSQLFPRTAPTMKTLEVMGLCRPARMVSGDYYDFQCLQETNMALAIGDVAGKGISAALLMASIQSIMRTQLSNVTPALAAAANGAPRRSYSTSPLVAQLNRQLYANTSPEKYATFLFGIYDESQRTLTYTNAGHLPPVLIRDGEPRMLEVTGTVIGAFPLSCYEEQTIRLEPGDLLVAYTDGITEPENEYGEEFGLERMIDLLRRHEKLDASEIVNRVMDAVRNWTGQPELPDDMTLVLARRIA